MSSKRQTNFLNLLTLRRSYFSKILYRTILRWTLDGYILYTCGCTLQKAYTLKRSKSHDTSVFQGLKFNQPSATSKHCWDCIALFPLTSFLNMSLLTIWCQLRIYNLCHELLIDNINSWHATHNTPPKCQKHIPNDEIRESGASNHVKRTLVFKMTSNYFYPCMWWVIGSHPQYDIGLTINYYHIKQVNRCNSLVFLTLYAQCLVLTLLMTN